MKPCTWLLAVLALSALAACAPADRLAAPEPQTKPRWVEYVHPWEISGQWQLVAVTGAKVSPQSPIDMLIGGSRVEALSRCVQFDFKGPFGQVVGARPKQSSSSTRPPPDCGRGLNPVETAFAAVMRTTRLLQPRPGGRVVFVGKDGEALFERPRGESELYRDDPRLMWGEWRVESISLLDRTTRDPGIRVLFKTAHIEAESSCKSWYLPYRQEGDRLTIQPNPISGCERDDFYSEEAFSKIMAGDVKIQRSSPMERLLVGSAGSIRLLRLRECARPKVWRVHCYPS